MPAPARFIILDRDGVINHDSAQFIKKPEEWKAIPGSLEAIARLNQSGFRVVLATNQSGIGRNLFDMDTLNRIHSKMVQELAQVGGHIDAIFYCPHAADSACHCRKPQPGMFRQIANIFNVDLNGVPAIGDSYRDLEAASTVGCRPVLVRTGKGEKTLADGNLPANTEVFADLSAAADAIINEYLSSGNAAGTSGTGTSHVGNANN